MLAALGYQESRWRPAAVSPRGAQGVMMLMPLTAKKMGVNNVFSPDENIIGGARYLAYMKERIPKRILDPDRTWLAMAAYNIGIGHLEDARIITQMRKKNPDRWADVRANLPRLSDPRVAQARETRLRQWPRNRAVRRTGVAVRGHPRSLAFPRSHRRPRLTALTSSELRILMLRKATASPWSCSRMRPFAASPNPASTLNLLAATCAR